MSHLEFRRLGRTDIKVTSLCLGTMMYGEQMDETGAFHQMDRAIDFGINFFDTAEMYTIPPKPETQGNSERYIGNWMKARGNRDKIILASKVSGRSGFNYLRDGGTLPRLTRAQIREALDKSLHRLQTDYLDLYQLHWPDRKARIFGAEIHGYEHYDDDYVSYEETLGTLNDLVKEGKIRSIGLSNETAYGTMRFLDLAEKNNWPRMASIQNAYSLVNRTFEYGLAEVAMEEQVGLLAYSPIAQGYLSGKYQSGTTPPESRLAMFGRLNRYQTPSADKAIQAYVNLAKDLKIAPAALAMQFVTTRPWVTSNIFGASNDSQLETIFESVTLKWTKEIEAAVNAIHAALPNPCP